MLSFRQTGLGLWAFVGFMVTASVVMNLRYKPLGEDAVLDTWTGRVRAVAEAPQSPAPVIVTEDAAEKNLEIAILERLELQHVESGCNGVRFAFPAPHGVEIHRAPRVEIRERIRVRRGSEEFR